MTDRYFTDGPRPTDREPSNGDDRCSVCGGEQTITIDRWDARGHYTEEVPCECADHEYREIDEPLELDALERGFPRQG